MTLALLQELLMALRANDADGYKSWLALGIEQLGMDVADLDSSFRVTGSQPNGQSRQTSLMWQQQPDYAKYKEKLNGEGWLINKQEGMLIQIKPDTPTQHAQFVLVSYYRLSSRLGQPVRQQRMLRHLGIEMWINLQKIGWQRCSPPS